MEFKLSMEMITLDKKNISAFIEGHVGIKHSQLILLQEYPMTSGWKSRLTGRSITKREFELLTKSKGMYLDNKQLKALLDDRELFLDMYEYLVEKNRSPLAKHANPMDAKRQVYLLSLKNQKIFKIGQSLDPVMRAKFLSKSWGVFDYSSSFIVKGLYSGIELEEVLHFILKKWNVVFSPHEVKGDGYTEWFKSEALSLALNEIKRISQMQCITREIITFDTIMKNSE